MIYCFLGKGNFFLSFKKLKIKYFYFILSFFLFFFNIKSIAFHSKINFKFDNNSIFLSNIQDSLKLDSNFNKMDSSNNKTDSSLKKGTLSQNNLSPDSINQIISYQAQDSVIVDLNTYLFKLYGKSHTNYEGTDLTANTIIFNQQDQILKAFGSTDTSSTDLNSNPTIKDKDITSISDTILFNLKTKKGLSENSYFEQGEIYIHADKMKKINETDYYASKVQFTTCNLDHPHYGFITKKAKLINNKLGVSTYAVPAIENVKLPIGLPFLIFPIIKNKQSGFTLPSINENQRYGFGLENGSFYYIVNDNVDLKLNANLYLYGSVQTSLAGRYVFRYKSQGSFNVSYNADRVRNTNYNNSSVEFDNSSSFRLQLNHSLDPKAHPSIGFNANINYSSSNFNLSQVSNINAYYQSVAASSVSFSKTWEGVFSLGLSLNHQQNNTTREFSFTLPALTLSMSTLYPFLKKKGLKSRWYEKISVGYNSSFTNSFTFNDTLDVGPQINQNLRWQASHNIPISLTLPQLGPVVINPFVSYNENWYSSEIEKNWTVGFLRADGQLVDTLITNQKQGFVRQPNVSTGINFSTRIFGTFHFDSSKKVLAIRHQLTPQVSISYSPDVTSAFAKTTVIDSFGNMVRYSALSGQPITYTGQQGNLNFSLDNFIEAKVRDKADTTKITFKKVKIIDGFGITGSYNLLADSFALSPLSIYFRTNLFNKININVNASLDMYKRNSLGVPINNYNVDLSKGLFGTITSASLSLSTSFTSKDKNTGSTSGTADNISKNPSPTAVYTPDDLIAQRNQIQNNPQDYIDFNSKWNINLNLSINYTKTLNPLTFRNDLQPITANLNISGDFALSEKWKIGSNAFLNLTQGSLGNLQFFISREMHCWQLTVTVIPFGYSKNFSLVFQPKSAILRDLKVNRTRFYY